MVTGLRDSAWELFADSCGPCRRTLRNGRSVIDVEATAEVNEEAAWFFLDFEADRMLDGRTEFEDDWTQGYRTYLRFGLLQPGKGQSHLIDSILRRSQWRQRHGLHGEQDLAGLRRRLSVPFERRGDLFETLGCDEDGCDAALPLG